MSMKPGREHQPVALERAPRGLVDAARRATMRSPRTPTSARYQGLPAPSTTRAPRKQRSSIAQTSASRLSTSSSSAMRTWPGREPAVDREHGAGHERRLVGGQEEHGRRPPRPACRCARAGYQRASRSSRSGSRATRSSQAAVRIEPGATALARTPCAAVARGDRPAEADQPGLGRAVGLVAVVAEAVHGGHADDRPAAALDHPRQDGADAQEGARERSVHVAPPRLLVDRDEVVAARRERVVDEHVDAPAERALDVGRRP